MSKVKLHQITDTKVDIATTDTAIVRAMTSMPGHAPSALLGSTSDVIKRENSSQGTLELALRIVSRLPGVRM